MPWFNLTHMGQIRTRATALTRLAAEMPRATRTRHPPPRERHQHPLSERWPHPPRQRPRPGASQSAWCPPQQHDYFRFTFCSLGEPSPARYPRPPPPCEAPPSGLDRRSLCHVGGTEASAVGVQRRSSRARGVHGWTSDACGGRLSRVKL